MVLQLQGETDSWIKKITARKNMPQEIARLKQQIEEMDKNARANTANDNNIVNR